MAVGSFLIYFIMIMICMKVDSFVPFFPLIVSVFAVIFKYAPLIGFISAIAGIVLGYTNKIEKQTRTAVALCIGNLAIPFLWFVFVIGLG